MEERLKHLKKSLEQTAFGQANFSKTEQVHQQIQKETLQQNVLQLLSTPKSGVELTALLHLRGQANIAHNEGLLYIVLHEAEQQRWLQATWQGDVKYYVLTKLGKEQLREDTRKKLPSIAQLLGGHMRVE